MTSTRDLLTTALDGGTPAQTPLSIYEWLAGDVNDDWRRLFDQGLGICRHVNTVKHIEHGVKDTVEERVESNRHYYTQRKETPVGTLQKVTIDGWGHEDWIKTPEDYKIRQWIVENTELVPQYDQFEKIEQQVEDYAVTIATGSRTPAMSINLDWAGTEQFCMDVATGVDELFELYHVQKKQFLEETRLIAAGPGHFVKWLENLTAGMLGPERYVDLLVSVYNEAMPILEAAGKRVMVHYDGQIGCLTEQIASAPFHIIESFTEPPEGDIMYDESRAAWPDKAFWANISVGLYALPEPLLRDAVIAKRERAGKKALAFEISEDLPKNWQESVPIVLNTLRELDT